MAEPEGGWPEDKEVNDAFAEQLRRLTDGPTEEEAE